MRPTDYSEETISRAEDYLDNHAVYGDVVPSIAGLSLYLGVTRVTIYDWAKHEDKAEFSYTLSKISAKQESLLINGGLTGEFKSPIAKLMLANHGYHESVKVDNLSSDGSMTPQVIERRIVDPKADN